MAEGLAEGLAEGGVVPTVVQIIAANSRDSMSGCVVFGLSTRLETLLKFGNDGLADVSLSRELLRTMRRIPQGADHSFVPSMSLISTTMYNFKQNVYGTRCDALTIYTRSSS